MESFRVWEIVSYAWTEIGIDEDECRSLVRKGEIRVADLPEVERMFFQDVCGSFAVLSFLIVPLMLWPLMPDWGFSDESLQERMDRWYARPYWTHFMNPLRVLGYPVALLFGWRYLSMLRRAVRAESVIASI
jgi:hypothetical protein